MAEETKTIELLPCPFCGGKAHFGTLRFSKNAVPREEAGRVNHFVGCDLCNAQTQTITGCRTKGDAADKWNARSNAKTERLERQLARAMECLNDYANDEHSGGANEEALKALADIAAMEVE